MSCVKEPPEKLRVTYSFLTTIVRSMDGTERRICNREYPRVTVSESRVIDSEASLQEWKWFIISEVGRSNKLPRWEEAVSLTAQGEIDDTSIFADFSLTDQAFASRWIMFHADTGTTHEVVTSARAETVLTFSSAYKLPNTFPVGSWICPIGNARTTNNVAYAPHSPRSGDVSAEYIIEDAQELEGYGSAALNTYLGLPLLDKRPYQGNKKEVGSNNFKVSDKGNKIVHFFTEDQGTITSGREYRFSTFPMMPDRQWWKLFLNTIKGRQKRFHCSTYRSDLTLVEQPTNGSFDAHVTADCVAADFTDLSSHTSVHVQYVDGTSMYTTVDSVATEPDGSYTITFLDTFGPVAVEQISWLEICRLASDTITIDYGSQEAVVSLSILTGPKL